MKLLIGGILLRKVGSGSWFLPVSVLHAVVAAAAAGRPGAPGVALAETGQSCPRPAEELQQQERESAERSHQGRS